MGGRGARDPRRGSGHATSLTKIRFDDIARSCLAAQGFTAESIPPKGQPVNLRMHARAPRPTLCAGHGTLVKRR